MERIRDKIFESCRKATARKSIHNDGGDFVNLPFCFERELCQKLLDEDILEIEAKDLINRLEFPRNTATRG